MIPLVSIAVVSHGQGEDVINLFNSLSLNLPSTDIELILIENLSNSLTKLEKDYDYKITRQINKKPKGYSENLNTAFNLARGEYFCVLNPDVIFVEEVFSKLIFSMENNNVDVIAPIVINSGGDLQDSFRALPTLYDLIFRRTSSQRNNKKEIPEEDFLYPDWIAAIFLLVRATTYELLGGFNSQYRLYFEDVDFSCRAWLKGLRVGVYSGCKVIHDAQRKSRKELFYFLIHISSAIKFFSSEVYWNYRKIKKY